MRRTFGIALSVLSIVGVNLVPVEMFLYRSFSASSAFAYFAVETAVGIILTTMAFLLISRGLGSTERRETFKGFLVFSIGFWSASVIFLFAFVHLILRSAPDLDALLSAIPAMAGFEVLEVVGLMLIFGSAEGRPTKILDPAMSRTAVLFLSVFLGIFAAAISDGYFVVPFIFLKTLADAGAVLAAARKVAAV